MKYEIGDEVLVKCKVIGDLNNGRYRVTNSSNSKIDCETVRSLFPLFEEVYPVKKEPDMTAEESWELARRIEGMRSDSLLEIFDMDSTYCILQDYSPQQAKDKIKAWEAKKEINVGDEVEFDGEIGAVTKTDGAEGFYNVLFKNGETGAYQPKRLKKTGRHIDIDGLLQQIGGNE